MAKITQLGEGFRGYSFAMRVLHWLMAIMMLFMIAAGIYMVNGNWGGKFPPLRGQLYDIHRGTGFLLFLLVVLRLLIYRFTTPPSDLPAGISPVQKQVSQIVHFLLYAILIIQPIFGWYATNAWGVKNISVFGWFNLPQIAEKNRELGNQLLEFHGYFGLAATALVAMHIGAAVFHHFVLKDEVLKRMLKT
ncbi:MAG: cytochrome b [Pseudomonadota bacterium]